MTELPHRTLGDAGHGLVVDKAEMAGMYVPVAVTGREVRVHMWDVSVMAPNVTTISSVVRDSLKL